MKHCPRERVSLVWYAVLQLSQLFQCDRSSSYVDLQVDGGMWFSGRGEASFKGSASSSTFSFYSNHGDCATEDCQRWLSPALSLYSSLSQASVKLCGIFEQTFKIFISSQMKLSPASTLKLTCLLASFKVDLFIWKWAYWTPQSLVWCCWSTPASLTPRLHTPTGC